MKRHMIRCFALLLAICAVPFLPAKASTEDALEGRYFDGYEVQYTDKYAYIVKDGQATALRYIDSIYSYGWNFDKVSFLPDLDEENESSSFEPDWHVMDIPAILGGYPVVAIASDFCGEGGVNDVTIPEGVLSIDEYSIDHCYGIDAITIPASATFIHEDAFAGCTGELGAFVCRVTEGSYADKYVQEHGFSYIYDLDYRAIPSGSYMYRLKDGEATICGYGGESEELVVPSHLDGYPVTAISSGPYYYLFSQRDISSVTLPEGITVIGDETFYWCSDLTSIHLPESLTTIGEKAFSKCESLAGIVIPAGVASIGKDAFSECPALTLTVTRGSYSETYARKHGIPYTYNAE